jgi:serine/threonine protein kinase/Tfp pilus assembly protein PilF
LSGRRKLLSTWVAGDQSPFMASDDNQEDRTQSFTTLTAGTTVSHYEILERIGAGGMGEVYLALDTELNRKVALKFLPAYLCQDEESRTRFRREAQAAAKLKHANIVTIYEVSEYRGRPFFAMEHIEGQSLRELISADKLRIDRTIELAIQILEGLDKAHVAGVIHRDIKPSNMVIDADGKPRLLDFGLALVRGMDGLTKTGSTLGTVGYMSPEQIQVHDADQRSDLFSFGVVMYEMITGKLPFTGDTEAAVMNSVLHASPDPLSRYRSGVPDDLQHIVSKLLEKDPRLRYQSASGVISDLKRIQRDSESSAASRIVGRPSRRIGRILVPAFIIVIVIVSLILKPWKIKVESSSEAAAAENRLAIMYFANLADPSDSLRLGEIVANLLITDLSESGHVQVVSSQRLYDVLKLLGKEGQKKIDRDVATQVARKANAKWMLLGNILNMEPELILTAQLIDVESGNAIASQRIQGNTGERVFSLVDKLTVEIENDLSLPVDTAHEGDESIADVTTNSLEAYRYYIEGVENGYKHYLSEARELFRKAIELDSTFAMAYYWLSSLEQSPLRDSLTALAVKYSSGASKKEQIEIKAGDMVERGQFERAIEYVKDAIKKYPDEKNFYFILGFIYSSKLDQKNLAIQYFEKAVKIDPMFHAVYNELAYAYHQVGEHDKSIWAINKYIELSPNDANPYDSRGDLYAYTGHLAEAIASYEKAIEIKPDFHPTRLKLGNMYLLNRDYEKADSAYRSLCADSNPFRRSLGRLEVAYVPLYQGKFNEALEIMDDAIAAARVEKDPIAGADVLFLKADVYCELGKHDTALALVDSAIAVFHENNPGEWFYFRHEYVRFLVDCAEFDKAQREAEIFRKEIEENDTSAIWRYWFSLGYIDFAEGRYDQSILSLQKAAADVNLFIAQYWLARAYLKAGRLSESVSQFDRAMNRYSASRTGYCIWSVKCHYYLGQAYEASGWTDKAIEQYETFLDIWKDADKGLEAVEDARARLVNLRNVT